MSQAVSGVGNIITINVEEIQNVFICKTLDAGSSLALNPSQFAWPLMRLESICFYHLHAEALVSCHQCRKRVFEISKQAAIIAAVWTSLHCTKNWKKSAYHRSCHIMIVTE